MIETSGALIAELAGVSRQAVYRANLPRTDSGLYDLDDPTVLAYIRGAKKRYRMQRKHRDTWQRQRRSQKETVT
jgi:predicted DNA-binding protein YlxM (UPF0122 family)